MCQRRPVVNLGGAGLPPTVAPSSVDALRDDRTTASPLLDALGLVVSGLSAEDRVVLRGRWLPLGGRGLGGARRLHLRDIEIGVGMIGPVGRPARTAPSGATLGKAEAAADRPDPRERLGNEMLEIRTFRDFSGPPLTFWPFS